MQEAYFDFAILFVITPLKKVAAFFRSLLARSLTAIYLSLVTVWK